MSGETILIVEDEWILSINLQGRLKAMGYQVLEPVTSGEDAIQAVSAQQPDLILMDIALSGQMNGIEASQHIGAISDIPIIFLSSHSEDAFVQDAKTALPYGYLIKPVFDRELAVTIEIALNRYLLDRCTRESEERFRNLFQNLTSVAVQGYGLDGTTRYWNRASQDIYGYAAQEAIGRNLLELIIPSEMQSDVKRAIQRMAETGEGVPASELSLMRKDGSRVSVFSSHTVLKSSGRAPEFFCIDIDLTEHKRIEKEKSALEDQNRQLQKAESLGRMAGAIAHHFNNIIGAAIGNLDLAIMDIPPGSEAGENLAAAMNACHRAAEVSSMMLTYLGQTSGKHEPQDLSETCILGLPILRIVISNKVIMESDFPVPGPIIHANINQMHQVLTNLLTNAQESFGDGHGTIRLAVKQVLSSDISGLHRFPVGWQPKNTAYACIEVKDTGCGIADRNLDKVFDPFFTTQFTGRGMGLPVVLGIVRAHNGGITVESEVGRGSIFRVFLPVSGETVRFQPQKTTPVPNFKGGTILLIDDEEMMRNIVKMMLSRLGYSVLLAKEGAEAVEVFKLHQGEIRCILSDLTMPLMDGWETLSALRKLSPNIPVILSSGYNEADVMAGEHPEQPDAFLGKPYRIVELDSTIRRVLSA